MSSGSWDYTVFWNETMNQIRSELSEQEYSMWFNRMEYAGASESEIIVRVPSSFYRDQVRQRYLPRIEEKLYELSGSRLRLEFSVNKTVASEPAPFKRNSSEQSNGHPADGSTEKRRKKSPHSNLKEEYNFDNFVIGANNSFAANAAMAIAKNPGTGYNPCLIYGGVGLGKT
ncbi:DnaA ATPase domain-containing protein, partial [Salinispira pacifica]